METLLVAAFCEEIQADPAFQTILSGLDIHAYQLTAEEFLRPEFAPVGKGQKILYLVDPDQLDDGCFRKRLRQGIKEHPDALHFCLIHSDVSNLQRENLEGFDDFLFWPCSSGEFFTRLHRFDQAVPTGLSPEVDEHLLSEFSSLNLVGKSAPFVRVLSLLRSVSRHAAPVLILGETGTGKENAARAIHYLGDRSSAGFVPVNCGALPDELLESELFGHERGAFTDAKMRKQGLVEIADGGTLFLDEVDSLSLKAQAALLRFLQTKEYRMVGGKETLFADVRILSASNKELEREVEAGRFREDLLFRLNVLNVTMPPLRERKDDIPLIASALLEKFAGQYKENRKRLARPMIDWLVSQPWRGNVRELENLLLREYLLSEDTLIHRRASDGEGFANETKASSLVSENKLQFQEAKSKAVQRFEQDYLHHLLRQTRGNVSEAARIAGKERRALGKLIKKYNIDRQQFRNSAAKP